MSSMFWMGLFLLCIFGLFIAAVIVQMKRALWELPDLSDSEDEIMAKEPEEEEEPLFPDVQSAPMVTEEDLKAANEDVTKAEEDLKNN